MEAYANIELKLKNGITLTFGTPQGEPEKAGYLLATAPFWNKNTGGVISGDDDEASEFMTRNFRGNASENADYTYFIDLNSYSAGFYRNNRDGSRNPLLKACLRLNSQNPVIAEHFDSVLNGIRDTQAAQADALNRNKVSPELKSKLKWVSRYFKIAELVSTWSKDPSSKVGAIIVGDKGQIISQGYNGFPRGVADTPERYNTREIKYKLVVHAEMNAILNALYNGSSVVGAAIYIHNLPVCQECAKAIIQAGISEVFIDTKVNERWQEAWNFSKVMFSECGVKCYYFNEKENTLTDI